MTDFFGRLLGDPGRGQIRPRLPGLFEPVDPGPAASGIAEVVELPFVSGRDPVTPEPEPAPADEPEAPQRSWPVWVRPDESPADPDRPENQADRTESAGERAGRAEIVAPARPAPVADPEPGALPKPVIEPAVSNPVSSAPERPGRPRTVPVERAGSPVIERPGPVDITVAGRQGPVAERVIARRATERGTRVTAVKPAFDGNPVFTEKPEPAGELGDSPVFGTVAGNPAVERNPASAGNRALAGQPRVSETEPVIQVSIGRIEVRATAPAPARRTTNPSKPPASQKLADYLRERTEGRR